MLILATTTDTIEVVLGATPVSQLPIYANYRDITTSDYTPGRSAINTNGTTAVVAVSAPAASTQRVIDFFSIYNPNVADTTVTVQFDLNGTEYILTIVTLAQHERLQYQEGEGWTVLTATGAAKRATDFFADEPLPVEVYGELVEAIESMRMAVNALTKSVSYGLPNSLGQPMMEARQLNAGNLNANVTTLTNQTQIGGFAAADQVPALMHLQADNLRRNIGVS